MDPVTIAKPPTRDDAALALRMVHSFLSASRLVWKTERPTLPGFYWIRDRHYIQSPYVVEVQQDFSEERVPLVVQEYRPEVRGVEYLTDPIYDGCSWAGPIEEPAER